MLSFTWCQAQRNYYEDDVVQIVKKWHQNEAHHYWPLNVKAMSARHISELKNVEAAVADSIIFMVIRLGKAVPDSIRLDTVALGKFSNLEYLAILNSPYAPFDFTGLSKLKTLVFDYVYNLQAIPETIGKLSALEYLLIMGANTITTLPEGIFDLHQLKTLKITGLRDTIGTISSRIGKLKNLEFLEIDGTVNLPESISELRNLREFRLRTKYGTNRPTKALFSLPKLEFLSYYAYEAAHLEGIEQLQSLRVLNLDSKFIPNELGQLKHLEGLMQYGYRRSTYPEALGQLQKLQALQIINNDSIVQAPSFIPELPQLRYLNITSCDKMSTFSPAFSQMKYLEEVDLPFNDLIREVPEPLSHLSEKVKIRHAKRRRWR